MKIPSAINPKAFASQLYRRSAAGGDCACFPPPARHRNAAAAEFAAVGRPASNRIKLRTAPRPDIPAHPDARRHAGMSGATRH